MPHDGLHFQIVGEAVRPPLPSVARLLIAAERGVDIQVRTVDVDLPRPQSTGHCPDLGRIPARHPRRQAVRSVVRHLHGLINSVVAEDRDDRPKDLFLGDGHGRRNIGEDGGFDVVADVQSLWPAKAAGDKHRAIINASLDQPLNLLPLRPGSQRAHLRIAFRRSDAYGLGGLARDFDHLRHAGAGRQDAGQSRTGLARVQHHLLHPRANRGLQVGVLQNNVG